MASPAVRLSPAFDHICIATRAVGRVWKLAREAGGQPHIGGDGVGFWGCQTKFRNGGLLEMLQPAGEPGGFLHRFVDASGEGAHHVTFKVSPHLFDAAYDRACQLGYSPIGLSKLTPAWWEFFLHPKVAQGIVVQIAAVTAGYEGEDWAWGARWPHPKPSSPLEAAYCSQPAASLYGLRLKSNDRAAALKLWASLLEADADELTDGGLRFRWPGSPMQLVVDVDGSLQRPAADALLFSPHASLRDAVALGGCHDALGSTRVEVLRKPLPPPLPRSRL